MPDPQDTSTGTLSLIFGILGCLQILPCIGPIIAIITGYSAKGTAGESNGRIGRILGWLAVCIIPIASLIIVLLGFFVFYWF
jgi:thiol:disulfide interchange protein